MTAFYDINRYANHYTYHKNRQNFVRDTNEYKKDITIFLLINVSIIDVVILFVFNDVPC